MWQHSKLCLDNISIASRFAGCIHDVVVGPLTSAMVLVVPEY